MFRPGWLVLITVAACNRAAPIRSDRADVPAASSASASPLAGYPLSRLRVASNPLEPLDSKPLPRRHLEVGHRRQRLANGAPGASEFGPLAAFLAQEVRGQRMRGEPALGDAEADGTPAAKHDARRVDGPQGA